MNKTIELLKKYKLAEVIGRAEIKSLLSKYDQMSPKDQKMIHGGKEKLNKMIERYNSTIEEYTKAIEILEEYK